MEKQFAENVLIVAVSDHGDREIVRKYSYSWEYINYFPYKLD